MSWRLPSPLQPAGKSTAAARQHHNGPLPASINVGTVSARAYGFQGQIDAAALEAAVVALVTDLPILAGRMEGLSSKNGSIRIAHSDQGALFTVARTAALSLAAMAPDTWPASGFTLSNSLIPFYMEGARMEGGRAIGMMQGKEPLLKVRLTQLRDGCILGITINHAMKDGVRWSNLMNHLAARYRQHGGGAAVVATDLICPVDRSVLSAAHVAEQLGVADDWEPPRSLMQPSLLDYLRGFQAVLADATGKKSLAFLHIPKEQLSSLKQLAAGVMAQLKAPYGFFGNAATTFYASVPPGEGHMDASPISAFQQLAGAIRRAALVFRDPATQLGHLREMEALGNADLPAFLAYVYGSRWTQVPCFTNYVPQQQAPDFGIGPPLYDRELTSPRLRNIAVIRAACAPYSEGLFVQLCLSPSQLDHLRGHPALAELLPQASWVGQEA
ncbi:hypothetical protein ABPG75_000060 [Micractinium tetrahymenae]